jgi:CHAT domain-containing protein
LIVLISLFCFNHSRNLLSAAASDNNSGGGLASTFQATKEKRSEMLDKIESTVQTLFVKSDFERLHTLADSLVQITVNEPDSSIKAELYYWAGVCELKTDNFNIALKLLITSVDIKKALGIVDEHYAKGIFNIGGAYSNLGNTQQAINFLKHYIEVATKLHTENSYEVASAYSTLLGAEFEAGNYDSFKEETSKVLGIISKNKNALVGLELGNLYMSIGGGYFKADDYAKARIYLEEAEKIYNQSNVKNGEDYINLINSLAITYGSLGQTDKESAYFRNGINLAVIDDSFYSFNIINSYAIGLGRDNQVQKGADLLSSIVEKARAVYGTDSRPYFGVLRYYAEYLLSYSDDIAKAISLYSMCMEYLEKHNTDANLKMKVIPGYAEALYKNGESIEALKKLQELLFPAEKRLADDIYLNPAIDSVIADGNTLYILRLKYEILWSVYNGSADQHTLEAAANTSELIISLIDKIRINISDEESRIILGDRYRDSYINAIRDFQLCFRNTGDRRFLEKAFEYSEKSKVAGLLASTRELNAIQFHIPKTIADLEKSLQKQIGLSNANISRENEKENPDLSLINGWKGQLLSAVKMRDSLALTFERDYPDYYTLKYSTYVPDLEEIPSIIGRNNNYLNYIVSDSLLYIYIVNRKYQELLAFHIDSSFFMKLRNFRKLLTDPSPSENARGKFSEYQELGNDLYNELIEPVRKYFISDNILISPDNLLSYLPFETLITSKYNGKDIAYRELSYFLNDFNISYAYSATFMKELVHRDYKNNHNLVAFAPVYTNVINIDSLLLKRQAGRGVLYDLPYARYEAEYVSDILKGTLYLNNDARESVFKKVAGNFDIIHLAMHTFMNDQSPMNSAMIFAQCKDLPEDGLLYTHEVYGIPLKARMVVLSSCNTGSGLLTTGEGILSLARGFMYSGSQSVVMSMWEIDDKSGTEVIKMFYDNLKKGMSKSEALRKARSKYLKSAVQLKSHPYFWSTLIVYGDNSPVYRSRNVLFITVSLLLVVAAGFLFYFWYRKYSR